MDWIDDGQLSTDFAMTKPWLAFLETDLFAQPTHIVGIPISQTDLGYIVPNVATANSAYHVLGLPHAGPWKSLLDVVHSTELHVPMLRYETELPSALHPSH